MIDSVLKGTGNSRFLKSAVPAGTSWADALAMLQAGTFPIDFNGINTEGFQQVGTPLNKANLLKDATAAQIGLPPSTTPDGMFQALGNTGELHVWRKAVKNAEDVPAGYTLGDVQTGNFKFVADSYRTFEFGTPSVDDAGNVGLNVEGSVNGRYNSNFDNLKGKFCRPPDSTWYIDASLGSQVIYIPADATFSQSGSYKYVDKYQLVTGYPLTPAGTTTTYPVSTNPKAYQEGEYGKAGYTLGDVKTGTFQIGQGATTSDTNRAIIKYGASISVTDTGTASIASESEKTVTSDTSQASVDGLKGKFFRFSQLPFSSSAFSVGKIYFFPANTVFTKQSSGNWYTSKYQTVTSHGKTEPEYTIEYLGKLGDKARVQVLSYVGTGTYGSSNPNSLTFDFVPKMVTIIDYEAMSGAIIMQGQTKYSASITGSNYSGTCNINGKTLTYHNTRGPSYQLNSTGVKYLVIAIG